MTEVVVVDDSALVRKKVERLLTKAGYTVTLVSSWDNVSPAMRSRPPVAVIDLQMPIVDGEVLIGIVKRFHPNLKVILFSSSDDDHIRAAKDRCGADAWLSKRDLAELPGLIEAILNPRQV